MRRVKIVVSVAALMLLVACSGGSGGFTNAGPPISISLLADATSITPKHVVIVTASVYDQSNRGAT